MPDTNHNIVNTRKKSFGSQLLTLENKIIDKENEILKLMIQDESIWINSLIKDINVNPNNFFIVLQNGVILCKLANTIQEHINQYIVEHSLKPKGCMVKYNVPKNNSNCFSKFVWRDNVHNFLQWCRSHT